MIFIPPIIKLRYNNEYSKKEIFLSMNNTPEIKNQLERISNLFGTDPGFYVVAIHSLIESIANRYCGFLNESECSFREKLEELEDFLLSSNPEIKKNKDVFNKIVHEHRITNRVRHNFETLSKNEAAAATHNLITLCRICSFADEKDFEIILKNTHLWDKSKSLLETNDELSRIRIKMQLLNLESSALNRKLSDYNENIRKLIEAENKLKKTKAEYKKLKNISEHRKEKNEELRHKLSRQKDKLKEQEKDAEEAQDLVSVCGCSVEEYIAYNERLSHYSRTRRDYETSIIKLSKEQQEVLDMISLEKDFLIKGSAGTGKTLILLKAIEKLHKDSNSKLHFSNKKHKDILLTYTGTLVKYNYYISTILNEKLDKGDIQTADSFLNNIFSSINKRYRVSYTILKTLIDKFNTLDFISSDELYTELEDFIFAGNVSKYEYLEKKLPRKGLKKPLNMDQRKKVWEIKEKLITEMEIRNTFSKEASRCRLLEYFKDKNKYKNFMADNIFIDESQDLSSAELSLLKKLSGDSIIMAGDSCQTIYGFTSPYAHAGIDLKGKSKTLHLNYRNTAAIHELSEIYRNFYPSKHESDQDDNIAFREGPVPELLQAETKKEMDNFLTCKTEFFTERIGYDPENICILCPSNKDIDHITDILSAKNYKCANIKNHEFSFNEEGLIRLSTFHSSKGIDFPVVIIYLPKLPYFGSFLDKEALDIQKRNLLYVGMTRAMDNLTVIMKSGSKSSPILDMEKAFTILEESVKRE